MKIGFLALAAVLVAPLAAIAADPPVVFQTQSPSRILTDVRAIVKMVGGDKAVKEFNDGLKEKLGDKGFDGLDIDRPVLGYLALADKIEDTVGVLAVPVTGEKEFLAFMERLGGPKLEAKDGVYTIPNNDEGVTLLMRFNERHAYFALGKDPTAALNPKSLVAPAKLHDPADKGLASVRVYFDRLPPEMRAQLADSLKQLKTKLDGLPLPPEASDAARKAVDEFVKLGKRYTDLLQDAESASARIILDGNSGEAALEVGLTGKPGSPLAKIIAARQPSTNKFAGLITPDTVAGLRLQLPFFAPEIQNAAKIGLEAAEKQVLENAPADFKKLIEETFKGLNRTVADGEVDGVIALRGPDKAGLYTVVGAVAFEDPSAIEKELKVLFKEKLPPEQRAIFNLDIAKVGNTNIHQVKIGGFLPPDVQKVFGEEASLTIAFAPNGIFFAFGPDAVNTLKTALEVKKGPSAPLEVVINPNRLGKLITTLGKELPPGFVGVDKVVSVFAVSLEGGKELRLKFSTNLKWMEGLGGTLLDGLGKNAEGTFPKKD